MEDCFMPLTFRAGREHRTQLTAVLCAAIPHRARSVDCPWDPRHSLIAADGKNLPISTPRAFCGVRPRFLLLVGQ